MSKAVAHLSGKLRFDLFVNHKIQILHVQKKRKMAKTQINMFICPILYPSHNVFLVIYRNTD